MIVAGHISKTKLRTLKYHRLCHFILEIKLFGTVLGTSGGFYDALHARFTRAIYHETNKHTGYMDRLASKVIIVYVNFCKIT